MMTKMIHRLDVKDLEVLRAIVEATRETALARSDWKAARTWHDLRDKLDTTLTRLQVGSPIPSHS